MSEINEIETGNFAARRWLLCRPDSIRIVNWNIDRGLQLQRVIEFLASTKADILLLQETDWNAKRTHHVNVAREIARKLKMDYVFGREFEELTQGSPGSPAYHGQATLSRWPLSNFRVLRFQKQSSFWQPRWFLPEVSPFQERIGGRLALFCQVSVVDQMIATYNLHLESKGNDQLRYSQVDEVLMDTRRYTLNTPTVLAGDFNLDVSSGPEARAIRDARFDDAFSGRHESTTPSSLFGQGRIIDWIFTRGSIRITNPRVHRTVSASDHYPLSVDLTFL